MHFDDDGQAWILDDSSGLVGWRTLLREPWKPGVSRLHLVRSNGDGEFRIVYAPEDAIGEG